MLKTTQLQYFVITVQSGSINKAAKALFISQPALTKQLLKLEEEVNCKLLKRTHRGIELTTAGRYLYNKAVDILSKLEETVDYLRNLQHSMSLRIGAIPSMANYLLPIMLQQKQISFSYEIVVQDITQMLVDAVLSGQLDCAVVQDFQGNTTLNSFHLFTEPYYAVFPFGHPLSKQETVHLREFIQYPIVMWHDPSDLRQSIRNFHKLLPHEPQFIDIEWNDSVLQAVIQGKGISYIPEIIAKQVENPKLHVRKLRPRSFHRKIEVIFIPKNQKMVQQIFAEPYLDDTIPLKPYAVF